MRLESLAYRFRMARQADNPSILFITPLERAGSRPEMVETLARHSDLRLTLGRYTHVGLHDQSAAIEALPAPPKHMGADDTEAA